MKLDVRHLEPDLFNDLIQELNPDVDVSGFEILSRAACGDGLASTADRIDLKLAYEKNQNGIPERMIFKTLLLNPWLRLGLPAILSLSGIVRFLERIPWVGAGASRCLFILVGLFQKFCPQAPDAMYEIESRFYQEVRPRIELEAPEVYGSRYDPLTRQFAILMEDLRIQEARFPNATESMPLETVKSVLSQMAILHGRYWQSAALENELSWVPTRLGGGMFPVFEGIGFDLIRYQVEQHPFKQKLLAPLERSVEELWDANWASQRLLARGPQTLLHGDTHLGNTYVLPDKRGGLIDFQLLVKGNPLIDVNYYIVTALDPSTRRQNQENLIRFYLDQMEEHGLKGIPTFKEAWLDFRLASIWGLVIGWLITPPVNYGEEITAANIERTALAVGDLDAFDAITEYDDAMGSPAEGETRENQESNT